MVQAWNLRSVNSCLINTKIVSMCGLCVKLTRVIRLILDMKPVNNSGECASK